MKGIETGKKTIKEKEKGRIGKRRRRRKSDGDEDGNEDR